METIILSSYCSPYRALLERRDELLEEGYSQFDETQEGGKLIFYLKRDKTE